MKRNLDNTGRIIRLIIALILLAYAWWASSWIALAFSLFTFYEAFAGWCVLFQLLGKSSCPIDKK
jgi:hypothetical protein